MTTGGGFAGHCTLTGGCITNKIGISHVVSREKNERSICQNLLGNWEPDEFEGAGFLMWCSEIMVPLPPPYTPTHTRR